MEQENNQKNQRTAALHNLGCKVNAYETEAMGQMLAEAGYKIVDFSRPADVYVINTCSVTNMADRKSRQMLHRARKQNPQAVIVATGCYVQTAEESLKGDLSVDLLIGNNKKTQLLPMLEQFFSTHRKMAEVVDINDGTHEYEEMHLRETGEHTRAFLKIQDGCNQFCSYCLIPYARGRVRSRQPENVYEEALTLAKRGYQEIVLTGIHLSSYGYGEDYDLLSLLKKLHEIEGIRRIRLGSLEPRIITEEFVSSLIALPKICPHFHLSLQSGCDATLRRMNRKYTTEEYAKSCALLRQAYGHPAITTDVIVGFPGESRQEFETTVKFLEQIGFYEMHVFQYSPRRGTRAERMEGQIPDPVKKERSEDLLALKARQSEEYRDYYIGREVSVLLEEALMIDGSAYMVGFTPEYVRVAKKLSPGECEADHVNHFVKGKIAGQLSGEIYLLEEASRMDVCD